MLMVVLLIGILAAIGVTQFVNFSKEAKEAAVKGNLAIIRNAIAVQASQVAVRCNVTGAFPPADSFALNDITAGALPLCTTTQIANAADRIFIASSIPPNPWSVNQTLSAPGTAVIAAAPGAALNANDIVDCVSTMTSSALCEATRTAGKNCAAGVAFAGTTAGAATINEGGWCYDSVTGNLWANTGNNDGVSPADGGGTEYQY